MESKTRKGSLAPKYREQVGRLVVIRGIRGGVKYMKGIKRHKLPGTK